MKRSKVSLGRKACKNQINTKVVKMNEEYEERETLEENQMETESSENSETEKSETSIELEKNLQSALAQKEHFRTKAEALEKEKRDLESKLKGAGQINAMPIEPLEVVKLGKALKDYDEEETEFIIRNASGNNPEDIVKAAGDEFVKIAIQARREKVAKEKKIPNPSEGGGGSSFREKSPEEIRKMTPEQYDNYKEDFMKNTNPPQYGI